VVKRSRLLVTASVVGLGLVVAVVIAAARPSGYATPRPTSAAGVPSDAEARALLTQTYDSAHTAADALAFCASSEARGVCINQYNSEGGRAGVPTAPPTILSSRVQGPSRVLTVCGTTGTGKTYRADFPVERSRQNQTYALLEVFWYSKTFSGTVPDGQPAQVSPGQQAFSC